MIAQPLLIKESKQRLHLLRDLGRKAHDETRKVGKEVSWLQFARKTKRGYRFLVNRERQWQMLERIAQEVAKDYPDYRLGQVVDILADLVNHRLVDYMARKEVMPHPNLAPDELSHGQEWLLALVQTLTYIPRSPWFFPLQQPHQNQWLAKNLISNQTIRITRREETDYIYFSINR